MGSRIRALMVFVVLLAVGAFLGSAWSQWSSGAGVAGGAGEGAGPDRGRVRVEVLNAAGRTGLAREVTEALRDRGFDVVFYGNAETFDRDSSVVLDRVGRIESARAVADALGIRRVRSLPDANLYLDVSVLLGKDWAPSAEASDTTAAEGHRRWWDLRARLRRR